MLQGAQVWWLAPIYKQTKKPWEDFKKMLAPVATRISEQNLQIDVIGGGRLAMRSADQPQKLRGEGLDGVILDEAAFMTPETWFECIRPTLSDRLGWAIMPTTPNGQNWFYELFKRAAGRDDYEAWQLPTGLNPTIPTTELEEARADLGGVRYGQEYDARFLQKDGAEWGDHCWTDLYDGFWPQSFESSAIAIDPSKGRANRDYAAIVFVGVSGGMFWVDAVVSRMSAPAIAEATLAMYREHGADIVGMEDNANQDIAFGRLVLEAAADQGMPPLPLVHYTQTAKKEHRIFRIGPHVSAKRIRFRDETEGCKLLEAQLREFPVGPHDDGPDALEQAIDILDRRARMGSEQDFESEDYEL